MPGVQRRPAGAFQGERGGRGSPGLSLVELMITVTLAAILVVSVYYIYNNATVGFRIENQVMDMQNRLRFASEHLRKDLKRAGFLASPDSTLDDIVCPKPATRLTALQLIPAGGFVAQPVSGANPHISPTSLVLFGDFFSGKLYRTASIVGDTVTLLADGSFPTDESEFNAIFTGNRYLRIVTKDRFEIMLPILESSFVDGTVRVNQAVPRIETGTICGVSGFGEALEVSVAGFVRYRLAQDTRDGADPTKTDLVREVLAVDGSTVIAGSTLAVAEWIYDLQFFDFAFDTDGSGASPSITIQPFLANVTGAGTFRLDSVADSRPYDLRALSVKITACSVDEDPSLVPSPRTTENEPLVSFKYTTMKGAARCISMGTRVNLESLMARNLKAVGP